MSDRIFGGLGLILALAFIAGAIQIEAAMMMDPLGPTTFPVIIGVALGLSSFVIVLRPDPEPHWPSLSRLGEILICLVVLIGYGLALPSLGFIIATTVASALLSWRLGTSMAKAALIGIGISLGIYVAFHLILGLSLAKGPLGF